MQLTMERLKHNTFSLCRCVNAVSAKSASNLLDFYSISKRFPRNQWVRLRSSVGTGYVFIDSEAQAGRYQNDIPIGIDSENITTIDKEIDNKQVMHCLDTLEQLLLQLISGVNVLIEGTQENIELIDPDIEELKILLQMLKATETASGPNYNESVVFNIAGEAQEVLMQSAESAEKRLSVLYEMLVKSGTKVGDMHTHFVADGFLASWFLVYVDVCKKLYLYLNESNETHTKLQISRCITFGLAGVINEPNSLLLMFINKLVKENQQKVVIDLGWQYLDIGEDYLNIALDSQDMEAFGSNLYNAALFFLSARQIFKGLLQNENKVALKDIEEYQKAEKVADEKIVKVSHSLCNIVMDRTGNRLKAHQLQVEEARAKAGDTGASQKIFELIEMWYFYPRYYSKILNEGWSIESVEH